MVDLHKDDMEAIITEVDPGGLFLWVATDNEEEELEILKHVEKWE